MPNYLLRWGASKGPLFILEDGKFLTRQRMVSELRNALVRAGINADEYCGHSLRIGTATTAASNEMEDALIKTLG